MKVSIVIVSYKDSEDLERCTRSIEKNCNEYELVIIDNNKENRGYTKGVNKGITLSHSQFIWLLNSDAVVLKGSQDALLNRFSYHEKVGIVGSMQLDFINQNRIRAGGVYPHPFPEGRHRGGYISMGHWQLPEKQTWQNFASVMLRASMIESVGLLDESMFLIYSDSSYCYTCRKQGFECWYEPRSRVLHELKASKTPSEWHKSDMLAFMKKWNIGLTKDGKFLYSDDYNKLDLFP